VQTPLTSSGSAWEPSLRLRSPASTIIAFFIKMPFRGQGRTHLHGSRGTACFDGVSQAGQKPPFTSIL
jgi:hypothetical protein